MDSSMAESIFDDGEISDAFSPEPVAVSVFVLRQSAYLGICVSTQFLTL